MNSFYVPPVRPNELYHYGILGMHWGIRRYQPYPKGYKGKGREVGKAAKVGQKEFALSKEEWKSVKANRRASGNFLRAGKKQLSTQEVRQVSLNRARKAADEKRQYEEKKARALREGSASEVLKFKGDLTNNELQSALTRINLESQLKAHSAKEIRSGMEKIDNAMKTVKTVTDWAKIGTDSYNTMAKIYNTTDKGQKKPWRMIGEKSKEEEKKRTS